MIGWPSDGDELTLLVAFMPLFARACDLLTFFSFKCVWIDAYYSAEAHSLIWCISPVWNNELVTRLCVCFNEAVVVCAFLYVRRSI